MRKTTLFALTAMAVMLISMAAPIAFSTGPVQPPVDTTTLYVGSGGWGPADADPAYAYDTASGELLFNTHDTLLQLGAPVGNQWNSSWDVQEQYWEFTPGLATNVPTRTEVVEDFIQDPAFTSEIVILNEEPIEQPFPLPLPIGTFWEDATAQPIFSYKILGWVDTNINGLLDPSDLVELNIYRWAPTVGEKVILVQEHWYHVLQADQLGQGPPFAPLTLRLHLSLIPDPDAVPPVCYWFTSPQNPGFVFHFEGWVDNNPDEILGETDVIYLKWYQIVEVVWDKIGAGFEYVPVTARTYSVLTATQAVPLSLHVRHFYYDFNIRTGTIDFYDSTGADAGDFDVYDAEYSFKAGLIQDQYGSPMWMFYKPFFDQMNSDFWETKADSIELTWLIHDAVEVISTNPPILRINVGIAFPDVAFKQIISQSWAVMMDKEWSIGMGMFNPDNIFLDLNQDSWPDWFVDWRHMPGVDPIDEVAPEHYVGTGPYHVAVADSAAGLVVMVRNPGYWQGWPAPNRKYYLENIDIEYIGTWATRREAFKACTLDVAAVPRAYIDQLLDPADPNRMTPVLPEIKTIRNISPALTVDNLFFGFTVSNVTVALYTGQFPDGAPYNFFNNTHVRKAFGYAFNHTKYLAEVYMGEAIARETVSIYGLVPDYYSLAPDPPYTYDKNLAMMESELKAAIFTQGATTQSVWDWGGFHVKILWNIGNDLRRLAGEFIQASFNELNAASGKNFQVTVEGASWPSILSAMVRRELPIWFIGWLADFADIDNFVRPYMHTYGDFSYFQNYSIYNGYNQPGPRTGLNKDQLIDLAVKTPDGPAREEMYKDLDDIFIRDVPNIPIAQGLGRRWQKYWVKGWYYDGLYPSQYYYKLYKEDACWADVTGPVAQYLPGQSPENYPDGTDNMRDIGYIAQHFGAKAPDPAKTPPYDIKWAPGAYGMGGTDVYGDRKIDMRDIGFAAAHFADLDEP